MRTSNQKFPQIQLKSQLAMTIDVDHDIQSEPCQIIYHTHNERLEQSSCCDWKCWSKHKQSGCGKWEPL